MIRAKIDKNKLIKNESKVADRIPYTHHYNNSTLFTKNGQMLKILRIDGFFANCESDENINNRHGFLKDLINNLASENIAFYQNTIRRFDNRFPDGDFPYGSFADKLNTVWKKELETSNTLVNEMYLTVLIKPYAGAQTILSGLSKITRLFKTPNAEQVAQANKKLHDKLVAVVSRITRSLNNYHPVLLSIVDTKNGLISLPISFLSYLVNGQYKRMAPPTMDIAGYLPLARCYFMHRVFLLEGVCKKYFGAIMGVKEYCCETSPQSFSKLLAIPHEIIITQSFSYINRGRASRMMATQIRVLENAQDPSISLQDELEFAQDELSRGALSLGWHHMSISTLSDSEEGLNEAVSAVADAITTFNIVREDLNMENAFWAQLPGNQRFIARVAAITSRNFASFSSFHNVPAGRLNGNHWGVALTAFETKQNTRYFFFFLVNDVGMCTIIAPTGGGKTALMCFLMAQILKQNPRIFYFDISRGAEIFIRVSGGQYLLIESGIATGFNPLQLDDSPGNRKFLRDWLGALLSVTGERLSELEQNSIKQAIDGNFDLEKSNRQLRHIASYLGVGGENSLTERLLRWYGNGEHAFLFDNETDTLDMTVNITGFDLALLMKDSIARAPVMLYLFHRLDLVLDGRRTSIAFDEGWQFIRDPVIAESLEDRIKLIRRKNGFIVFATNEALNAQKSSVSNTLIEQTKTNIFFPNPKADFAVYSAFGLSEYEIHLIKTMNPADHYLLIKQVNDSVVVKFDLSAYPDLMKILSSKEAAVRKLDQLREKHGDDPKNWIDKL